jgi:hypothetical protein
MPLAQQFPEWFTTRLADSITWSRRQLLPFQEKKMAVLRQYVGRHYGGNTSCKERVPNNFIRLQMSILGRHLVSRSPSVLCEAADPALRAAAYGLQEWANMAFPAMGFEEVLARWAMEALIYPVGMIKVCTGMAPAYDGPDLVAWADVVDSERQVVDMLAADWKQVEYLGHYYTADKEKLVGPGFDEEAVSKLQTEPHRQTSDQGAEKTESLQQTDAHHAPRLRDYIDCCEVYLPKEYLTVTFPIIGNTIDPKPIRVEEYFGARNDRNTGPFHILDFDKVPGALMATPPVHAIYDLHEAINKGVRKMLRQMERQKDLMLVGTAGQTDAQNVRKGADGDMIPVTSPDAFKEMSTGGPNPKNLQYILSLAKQVSMFGGNFEVLGGLAANAPTLGQEELLSSGASTLIKFYQGEMVSRTRSVCEALLWHEWHSRRPMPYNVMPQGMPEFAERAQLMPQQRYSNGKSHWSQVGIKVHPYSMRPVTPEQRLGQWMQILTQFVVPLMPMLQAQGASIDMVAAARKLAGYLGLNDFDEVVKVTPLDPTLIQQGSGGAPAPRTRPPGTGEYTRTNVSSQEDQDQNLMAAMTDTSNEAA